MGKKKERKKALKKLRKAGIITSKKVKNKCCDKYKKDGDKRCSDCPCFDLLKTVA